VRARDPQRVLGDEQTRPCEVTERPVVVTTPGTNLNLNHRVTSLLYPQPERQKLFKGNVFGDVF